MDFYGDCFGYSPSDKRYNESSETAKMTEACSSTCFGVWQRVYISTLLLSLKMWRERTKRKGREHCEKRKCWHVFNFTIKAMYVASHDTVCNEKSPLGNECRI